MRRLFARRWDLISATLANVTILYPIKVVSDDRTTTIVALSTTVGTLLLHSLINEVGNKIYLLYLY